MAIKVGDGTLHCSSDNSYFCYGIVFAKGASDGWWKVRMCDGREELYSREATNYYRNAYKKMVKDVTRNLSSRNKRISDELE